MHESRVPTYRPRKLTIAAMFNRISKKYLILLLPLVIIFALVCYSCDDLSIPGASTFNVSDRVYTGRWRNTRTLKRDVSVRISKKDELHHLIIYAGKSIDAIHEIDPVLSAFHGLSYNIITTASPLNEADYSKEEKDDIISMLIEEGFSIPGFRKRTIIVHGRMFEKVMKGVLTHSSHPAGIILINPENVIWTPRLEELIKNIKKSTPFMLIHDNSTRNYGKIPAQLHQNIVINVRYPLNLKNPQWTFPAELIQNDNFNNYLLIQRHELKWVSAIIGFPKGCFNNADMTRPVSLAGLMLSGMPENDLCPLFSVTARGQFYRAERIDNLSCVYRLSGSNDKFLYCKNDPIHPQLTDNRD